MRRRRKRACALPEGRLPRGREGAVLRDKDLSALASMVREHLDRRPCRTKPLSETELRKRLTKRPLNVGQANRALTAAVLSGHIAVARNGKLMDARALVNVLGGEDFEDLRLRTETLAEKRLQDLLAKDNDPERAKHFAHMVSRRLEALPRRLWQYGHFDIDADSTERALQRRQETQARRLEARRLFVEAQRRVHRNDWAGTSAAEQAMGVLVGLVLETGIGLDDARLADLHTAATRRLVEAHGCGVPLAAARSTLLCYWRALAKGTAAYNAEFGKTARVAKRDALAPLTHRREFWELLQSAGLVAHAPLSGGVRLERLLGGTVKPVTVPPAKRTNLAEKTPVQAIHGTQKRDAPRVGEPRSRQPNRAAGNQRRRVA